MHTPMFNQYQNIVYTLINYPVLIKMYCTPIRFMADLFHQVSSNNFSKIVFLFFNYLSIYEQF